MIASSMQGDVLEISAGTGRNLPHYYLSKLQSLTLTDLSHSMLDVAEDKYYHQLKLGYKYPDVKPRFLLSDAEHMVAAAGEAATEVPLRRQAVPPPLAGQGASAALDVATVPGGSRGAEEQERGGSSSSSTSRSRSTGLSGTGNATSIDNGSGLQQQEEAPSPSPFKSIWKQKQDVFHTASKSWSSSSSGSSSGATGRDALTSLGVGGVASPAADDTSSSSSSGDDLPPSSSSSSRSSSSSTGADKRGWWSKPCPCGGHHGEETKSSNDDGAKDQSQLSTFAPGSYDVIVDTFGLCSHEDPVQVGHGI